MEFYDSGEDIPDKWSYFRGRGEQGENHGSDEFTENKGHEAYNVTSGDDAESKSVSSAGEAAKEQKNKEVLAQQNKKAGRKKKPLTVKRLQKAWPKLKRKYHQQTKALNAKVKGIIISSKIGIFAFVVKPSLGFDTIGVLLKSTTDSVMGQMMNVEEFLDKIVLKAQSIKLPLERLCAKAGV